MILPNYLVTAFNVILVKNYFVNNVPDALIEAAQIDGASEFTIFTKVMFPLAKPTVATISLFTDCAIGMTGSTDCIMLIMRNYIVSSCF